MSKEGMIIQKAVELANDGCYQQAIRLLGTIDSPKHLGEVNYYLGLWHFNIGDSITGRRFFQQSILDITSPFAYRSLHNLSSICKRDSVPEEQLAGFKYLERALEMSLSCNWPDEQDKTIEKMARYLLDLNLFDFLEPAESRLNWAELRTDLPSLDMKDKQSKSGAIALHAAILNGYYLRNFERMAHRLGAASGIFESKPEMLLYITKLQQKIMRDLMVAAKEPLDLHKSTHEKENLTRLIEVGAALTSELDLEKLLEMVVHSIFSVRQ